MNKLNKLILLSALLSCSQYALAVATCTVNLPARNFVATLAPGNVTVGPDTPNGTVIYRLNFNDPGTATNFAVCGSGPFSVPQTINFDTNPLALSSWNGSPFPGKVYQTSVPGIGVAIWSDLTNQALPTNAYITTYTGTNLYSFNVRINTILSFIKIGNVSPGTINGSQLPTVKLDLGADPSLTGMPIRVYNLSFNGSLNIVSQTCTTPDVNVAMGSFEVSKYFTGIGSTTPWKDASIIMTNCPVFYGYFNNSFYNNSSGSGNTTVSQPINNTLSVKLTPATTILNSSNGIFAIDSSNASAAKGVGIQLGYGATSSPSLLDFSKNITTSLTSSQQSVNIPLSARYYQTESTVSPGRADGKVVFLINYY